ncbi:MAG: hypothetical protein A2283_19870 [Lentisphaerae bacterium RIFOXYA12_FULL_48_11]|nr:MAG: hypothetical protein A2283_19870 [Lentisphaerae bacterium RIFOXYA12_FULL_48_11]
MKFKTDENIPVEACQILQHAGHDAVSVLDQRLGGHPDMDIAAICKSESRVLITLDTDFGNILSYPPHEFAGIIVIRTDDQSKNRVLDFIHRIINVLRSESPHGHLWIIEHNRIRIRGPE